MYVHIHNNAHTFSTYIYILALVVFWIKKLKKKRNQYKLHWRHCTNKAVPEITEDKVKQHCHRKTLPCLPSDLLMPAQDFAHTCKWVGKLKADQVWLGLVLVQISSHLLHCLGDQKLGKRGFEWRRRGMQRWKKQTDLGLPFWPLSFQRMGLECAIIDQQWLPLGTWNIRNGKKHWINVLLQTKAALRKMPKLKLTGLLKW